MRYVLSAILLTILVNFSHGQQSPPKWHKPPAPQRADGGFWRLDHTFKAKLSLVNIVQVAPVTVTPVLYMADGTRYQLDPVTLPAAGDASVDIADALSKAPPEIQPHLSEFGSASIEFSWPWATAVSGRVENLDVSRSLVHHFALHVPSAPSSNKNAAKSAAKSGQPESEFTVKEGLWWKHDDDVTGFVTITNNSKLPIQVHVSAFGAPPIVVAGSPLSNEVDRDVLIASRVTELMDLNPTLAQHRASRAGGIRVSYKGSASDISVSGGLENPEIGYSASIPFVVLSNTPSTDHFDGALVGMMVGAPDPMMMFPEGTNFSPYLAIQNMSSTPATISLTAFYSVGADTKSTPLPKVTLQPNEAQTVDLSTSLKSVGLGTYSGAVTFAMSSDAPADRLLVAAGSVDQTGTYVFEVSCTGVGVSEAKLLGSWNLANGNDTMISLWNANNSDQDAAVLLFFDGGQYSYPVHLTSHATTMFNVSDIVNMHQPDANGSMIPATIQHGSAVLAGPKGQTDSINIGASVGTFNVETATCTGGFCPNCIGYVDYWIEYDPVSLPLNGSLQNYALAQDETGNQFDYTSESTWSASGDAGVNGGLISAGSSGGSFTLSAKRLLNLPSDQCGDPRTRCPADYFTGDAGGTVQVPTSLSVVSVSVLTNTSGTNQGCPGSHNYGILIDIVYQVRDQTGAPIASSSMKPHEAGTHFDGSPLDSDIGGNNPAYPSSSQFTASDGTFHDIPFGSCSPVPISNPGQTATQNVTIIMNGTSYPVRSQHFTITAPGTSSFGHGSITNDYPNATSPDVKTSR